MGMDSTHTESENLKTRQRLLEVAGMVFAEQGFKCATVREICKRAGANVAAINYHFGDKQGLYSETLRYWVRESLAKYPPNLGVDESATPEQKLHAYVRSFFWRIFDEGRPSWYGKLMAREMLEPTHALDAGSFTAFDLGRVVARLGLQLGHGWLSVGGGLGAPVYGTPRMGYHAGALCRGGTRAAPAAPDAGDHFSCATDGACHVRGPDRPRCVAGSRSCAPRC